MNKPTIRTITSATAVAAAMLFGASAMAQTPPGGTKAKDAAVMPAPATNAVARGDASTDASVSAAGAGMNTDTSVDAKAAAKMQKKEARKAMRDERAVKQNSDNDSVGNLGVPATKGDGKS